MPIPKNSGSLFLIALLFGCSDHPNEIRIAEAKIPVYDGVEGKVLFSLQPTDRCEPGMEMAGKVDMYTKVKCNSGEGWVMGGGFKKIARGSE
ncbi:MAG: hypothetical protein PPHEMADM_5728 [uncultured Paraburkholderia sp.]|nr:MAG: hypothetical protein PPHEINF_6357 [uncultured Paraburkholderia sp.]CAH2810879.1 MAG: hypothetical protein PPHEESC_6306 [uncultured Paraburkholderia sp.]CAH2904851.1 MAG: hypothetical protein PPHEMADE_5744 [uncultured Paraburkholderia sp.]CAH2945982.1 MAG: hypothetical protein PPHEMADMSA_6393 [uncultured Paraburkholderia sp.]CAH2946053.1 MAG: hypothetical protein PPHEMADM_5728 [uncultured Paraburkholderia sp.]